MATKVETGRWVHPRGRREGIPVVKGPLQIVISEEIKHLRYLTIKEIEADFKHLLSIDPSKLVFIIGSMTARRDPNTLRMPDTDKTRVNSAADFFKEHGLVPYNCFERQNYGEWGVTSEQASMLDGTALDRASLIACLPGASMSANAGREIKRGVSTGKSLILFHEEPEEEAFAERIKQLILSAPISYPASAIVPIKREIVDLYGPLGELLLEAA